MLQSIVKRTTAKPDALFNHKDKLLSKVENLEKRDAKIKKYLELIESKIIKNDTKGILELVKKASEKTDVVIGSIPRIRREIDNFVSTTFITRPYKRSKNVFKKKKGMKILI